MAAQARLRQMVEGAPRGLGHFQEFM
jgi:hypothetical protein